MNLLLDTHIWIWSAGESGRLSRKVIAALEHPGTRIWLSPISVWEALVLARKGRVDLGRDPQSWVAEAFEKTPVREAPLTRAIAEEADRIDLPHGDPADRFIAATASVLGLTLVTADSRLLKARSVPTLAHR